MPRASQAAITSLDAFLSDGGPSDLAQPSQDGEVTKSQPKQAFHPHSRLYSKRAEQCCEEGPWSRNQCCHVRWLWRDPPQWELWSLKHTPRTGRGRGQTRPPEVGLVEAEWWAHEGLLYNYFYVCIQLESSTIKSIIQKKQKEGKHISKILKSRNKPLSQLNFESSKTMESKSTLFCS